MENTTISNVTSIHESKIKELSADLAYDQFLSTHEFAQLEIVIELLRSCLESPDTLDAETTSRLFFKFARCLRDRFDRGRDPGEIENAITFARMSIDNIPDLEQEQECRLLAARKTLLWNCLITQAESLNCKDTNAFHEALDLIGEIVVSLEEFGIEDEVYKEALHHKAFSLMLRWERDHVYEDLEEALRIGYQVCGDDRESYAEEFRNTTLSDLAYRLQRVYKCFLDDGKSPMSDGISHGEELGDEALKYILESNSISGIQPLTKISNILTFVEFIHQITGPGSSKMLVGMHGVLVESLILLEDIMRTSLRIDQLDHVSVFYGLSRFAAAASLENGNCLIEVLQILEKGRGMAMSISMDLQQCEGVVEDSQHYTMDDLIKAKQRLANAVAEGAPMSERILLLEQIHNLEGKCSSNVHFEEENLRSLAVDGPIVVINLTNIRSDVIIITSHQIFSILLPSLNEENLSSLSWEIQWRLAQERGQVEFTIEIQRYLLEVLEMIWESCAKPILDTLGFKYRKDDIRNWPRICWIPTGVLSLYPLHAAGLGVNKKSNVMNRVLSSYAPSLTSLMNARRRKKTKFLVEEEPVHTPAAAILAMVKTNGHVPRDVSEDPEDIQETAAWCDLDSSKEEIRLIRHHFPKPSYSASDFELHPTTKTVIDILEQRHPIVHISCHGYVNYVDPSKSMLLFSDWEHSPLTTEQIGHLKINSDLAFLSTCFTANSGVDNLQDEMIQITTALYTAGFSNVIGSLWKVEEVYAMEFVGAFYEYLGGNCGGKITSRVVIEAFHVASVKISRSSADVGNRMKGRPAAWAPFICLGI